MTVDTRNAQKCFTENLQYIGAKNATSSLHNIHDWNLNTGLRAISSAVENHSLSDIHKAQQCFRETLNFIGPNQATATRTNLLNWNLNSGLQSLASGIEDLIQEVDSLRRQLSKFEHK